MKVRSTILRLELEDLFTDESLLETLSHVRMSFVHMLYTLTQKPLRFFEALVGTAKNLLKVCT